MFHGCRVGGASVGGGGTTARDAECVEASFDMEEVELISTNNDLLVVDRILRVLVTLRTRNSSYATRESDGTRTIDK